MGMQCDRCTGETFTKAGRDHLGRQQWRCQACGRRLATRSASAFSGYRFPDEIIALTVRWYLRFRLSYADVAEWLTERGGLTRPSSRSAGAGGTPSVPSTRTGRSWTCS